jgi:hypothetical protein
MHGKKILLDGDTPALIRQDMNTNGIGAEFLEALKLRFDCESVGQVFGLANVDAVMARPAIGAVVVYGRQGFESRSQRPYLKVVFFARFAAEGNAAVSRRSAVI